MDTEKSFIKKGQHIAGGAIHFVLSHSYLIFLMAIVGGVIFQMIFPIPLFVGMGTSSYIGGIMIILGSAIIYWAQSTSHKTEREMKEKNTPRCFDCGPYKYSRNPTHIGLSVMTIGLGIMLNSFFIFMFLIIASLVSKFIFLKKEEALLEQKYGQEYREYKKRVSTWV
jgi:protein-S-isoprenylcysteine O-methyltransferase Ste14